MTNNIQDSTDSQREIQQARESINDIDHSLVDLLRERFKTSARIGQIKADSQMPVLDASREQRVLDSVGQLDSDPETRQYLQNIFREILKNSRDYQHELMQKENK